MGYHEFLQFCEDAGIDAMYVFNCGMTCQARCPDYFDDKLIEDMYISAVCTVDETSGELIIKLVNITENDITVNLASDIPLANNALITTLTAESMQTGNSFDTPEAVVPVTNEMKIRDGKIDIGARSVNVIRTALR